MPESDFFWCICDNALIDSALNDSMRSWWNPSFGVAPSPARGPMKVRQKRQEPSVPFRVLTQGSRFTGIMRFAIVAIAAATCPKDSFVYAAPMSHFDTLTVFNIYHLHIREWRRTVVLVDPMPVFE